VDQPSVQPPTAAPPRRPPESAPPLAPLQWLVWWLATAGKFFEGLIVFMGGIALPLVAEQFALAPRERGLVAAATLLGILIGALALGGLADRWGRRPVFIAAMGLLLVGLLAAAFSPGPAALVGSLLLIGLALGADYPTGHLLISETIPAAIRGRLVLGSFSFQAVGAVAGTVLAAQVLAFRPALEAWRLLYLLPVPAVALVLAGRLLLPESSPWLVSQGDPQEAARQRARLLNRPAPLPDPPDRLPAAAPERPDWRQLFAGPLRRASLLAALPWFLQDLATYGIGIFAPLILATAFAATAPDLGGAEPGSVDPGGVALIHLDRLGARAGAVLEGAFLLGIGGAILLADRWGRIPLQILGFLGCAVGLAVAGAGAAGAANLPLLVGGLLLFQVMTNLGPNAQTYLLAGEVFPTPLRGLGAGMAAAAGKVGAVLTAFLFPSLMAAWGSARLLPLLALTSLLGAAITWHYRIETKGLELEPPPPEGAGGHNQARRCSDPPA
jgi:putative MFS transporter